MKDYMQDINELKEYIIQQTKVINEHTDDEKLINSILCDLQQRVIDLGMDMESKGGLEGTRIIRTFEVLCEVFYRLLVKEMSLEHFNKHINWQMYMMESDYLWSMPKGTYGLSIVAIIKNERNILEWIEYHRLVGVEHFYIYDNESTDGLEEKLKPYIEEGLVTYTYYPGKYLQFKSYNDAIEKYKYDTKWLAVIDGDEYIVPMEEGKNLLEILDGIERDYMNHIMRHAVYVGGVGVNWRDYGTSGHKTPVDGLIIEHYKYRGEDDFYQNVHIKTIYNPRVVSNISNPHYGSFISDKWINISENGSYIRGSYFYDSMCKKIRINHYFSKSEEELVSKNKRGWPDRDLYRPDEKELYEAGVMCNKVYDPIMDKFVDEVKKRLG